MTQFAPRTEEFLDEDRRWIGDSKKIRADRTINLDPALFDAAQFPDGVVKSGTVLARRASGSRLWGPYDPAADFDPVAAGAQPDGLDTAGGFLFTTLRLRSGGGVASGALYDNGAINVDRLPVAAGAGALDADARVDLSAHFRFYE
jgi:hypothetical protein